ncbi:MAG: c-type cytochrome biogenesis protein CcmI [Hyphomicrobiales bacterium]|nr:c-type cytochrome biogenesis protein CcmI [Hyphomicrobiales bacterium]
MIFWIIAVSVTVLSIGIIIFPIFGGNQISVSTLDFDKEIYKARLKEIEEERKLGSIDEQRYQYAVAEEGRRLLTLADKNNDLNSTAILKSGKSGLYGLIFIVLVVPVVALGGYSKLGSITTPDQPLQARLEADPRSQSVEVLLKRAENQLIKNPDDGRGWLVVAPVYMRLGRYQDGVLAYRTAIRILGATTELQIALGEALTVRGGGVVSEEANELFRQANKADPENIKPMFFLAIAFNQVGKYEEAVGAWNKLIAKSSKNAPWLKVARQQLEVAKTKLGIELPGNPTTQDIEDAKQLSSGERTDFINAMVEKLAGELDENPQNKPGWQRIIRSYTVLKRKADALAAINKAQRLFKDDKTFLEELEKNKQALN